MFGNSLCVLPRACASKIDAALRASVRTAPGVAGGAGGLDGFWRGGGGGGETMACDRDACIMTVMAQASTHTMHVRSHRYDFFRGRGNGCEGGRGHLSLHLNTADPVLILPTCPRFPFTPPLCSLSPAPFPPPFATAPLLDVVFVLGQGGAIRADAVRFRH